jgi:hypothetical protein
MNDECIAGCVNPEFHDEYHRTLEPCCSDLKPATDAEIRQLERCSCCDISGHEGMALIARIRAERDAALKERDELLNACDRATSAFWCSANLREEITKIDAILARRKEKP